MKVRLPLILAFIAALAIGTVAFAQFYWFDPTGTHTMMPMPLGGTTGQALVKNSNADWDYTWGAPAAVARVFNNAATKTIVTSASGQGGVVLDASRDTEVHYWVDTSITTGIGGTSAATAYLEIAATNSATPSDWTTIKKVSNGQSLTLAIALQSVQPASLPIDGMIPAGQFMRVRDVLAGTSSCAWGGGQEIKQ